MEYDKIKKVVITIDTSKEEKKLKERLEKEINEIITKELKTTEFEYVINIVYKMKGN